MLSQNSKGPLTVLAEEHGQTLHLWLEEHMSGGPKVI